MKNLAAPALACLLALASGLPRCDAAEDAVRSHPPMRPLPTASTRPLSSGPTYFADARHGADTNDGSRERPWKTIGHALPKLIPGDTLCLRGGIYYESVIVAVSGAAEEPITIRSHSGEMAIIDAGLREFFEEPAPAWEPFLNGALPAGADIPSFGVNGRIKVPPGVP
jgi:hypothetical protein